MAKTDTRRSIDTRLLQFSEPVQTAVRAAFDKKAQQVTLMDLRPAHAFTDAFVICSGQTSRQVKAVAEGID